MSDPLLSNEPAKPVSAQESSTTASGQTPGEVITPQPPENAEQPTTHQPSPESKKSNTWLLLLFIVLIIAGAIAASHYVLRAGNQRQTTPAKRDIPYLTYGLEDGDLTQTYPAGSTATAVQVDSQLFEGLVRYDQQTKLVPQLATNWSNPDTSTWVFNLRRDVTFHSGRNMTAQDVKYSLDYAVEHQNDDPENSSLALATTIKQVDVTGTYQVKITTDGPDPILLNRLSFLYIMDSKAQVGDPNNGTGPYVVKTGTKPTENSIDLTAYDHYYGGHVYTRALHIGIIKNDAKMAAAVNNGTFDLAGSIDDSHLGAIKRHYQKIKRQDLGVSFLGINTLRADSPLSSVEGRQAAADALDIPTILKAGGIRGEQASQLIPPTLPGYDPSIKDRHHDQTKAKQLLAGVKNASAPLTLEYVSSETNNAYFAEIVKELKAVGFNITATAEPDLNTLVDNGFSGKADMFSVTYDSATLDGLDVFTNILQGNQIYNNPEVDTLAEQAASTINPTDRVATLQKISKIVATDVPDIPMYTPTDVFTLTKLYHLQIDIPGAWAGVYFWHVYQK